jgi:hypothetical protein
MARKVRELRDRKTALSAPNIQFSVQSVFLFTAAVAVMTLFVRELHLWFGAAVAAVAVLTGLSIFAHVAGVALGTRLRASEDQPLPSADENEVQIEIEPGLIQPLETKASDFAPATQLSHQKRLKRKPVYYAVGFGASLAAIMASVILTMVMCDNLAIANILFGAFSAAVIGGLFGFWLSSFFQVVRSALAEASEDE